MAISVRVCAPSVAGVALFGLLLAGCASSPQVTSEPGYRGGHGIGYYRVGSPYKISGVWYYPAVDYNYDTTGIASWYGEQFEGRLTANGEIFDLNQLTAAHTTLPMPSIVQVSNLENGRSLQLRVNDRGPFVDGRLIDVSRRAAQLLGFEGQGTTLVRVKVLKEESIAAAEEAMQNSGQILVADAGAVAAAPTMQTTPRVAHAAPSPAAAPAPAAIAAAPPPASAPQKPPPPPVIASVAPAPLPPVPLSPPPPQNSSPALAAAAPPATRPAASPFSRFALIARAEAAELPPPRRPVLAVAPRPAPEKPNSPARVVAASAETAGRIYVQAGAFSLPDNARRVQSHLSHLGSAQVTIASVHGVEMYRVRLGPYQTTAQAQGLLERLVESGYREARLVGD
jgi:rare lipoprotein A